MNILTVTEKLNRRKKRVEYKKKRRIMRIEFDPKAIRARFRRQQEQAQALIRGRNAERAMLPPVKHENFISKIKNKIYDKSSRKV